MRARTGSTGGRRKGCPCQARSYTILLCRLAFEYTPVVSLCIFYFDIYILLKACKALVIVCIISV